jgi:hypothetical protein
MQAKKDTTYSRAIVLDEPALKKLDELMLKNSGAVSYEVRLSDGTNLEPAGLNDVLNLSNPENRRIRRISASGPYNAPLRVDLSVQDDSFDDTVNVSIRGEEKDVVYVSRQLDDWVGSISRKYGFVSIPKARNIFALLAMFYVALALFTIPSQFHWTQRSQFVSAFLGAMVILTAVCVIFFARTVFPIAIFAIGDGVRRRQLYEARQSRFTVWAIAGVILAFALSMLANRLSH